MTMTATPPFDRNLFRSLEKDRNRHFARPPVAAILSAFLYVYTDTVTASVWLAAILATEAAYFLVRTRAYAGHLRILPLLIPVTLLNSILWVVHALLLWRAGGDIPHVAFVMDLFTVALYAVVGTHRDLRLMLALLAPPLLTLTTVLSIYLWMHAPPMLAPFAIAATIGGCGMLVANGLTMHRSDRDLLAANDELERRATELHDNRQFLEEVSDLAQVGGWNWDVETGTLTMSATAKRIYELPEDSTPTLQHMMSLYRPDERKIPDAALLAALDTGEGWDGEIPTKTSTGRKIWLRVIGRAVRENGRTVRLVGATQDITARIQSQQELARLAEAAHAANRAKDGFLANMSHEIRTPLNGIVGLAATLVDTDLDDRQREMAQLIHRSGETLERLLSDLLDLTKIESGLVEVQATPFDLVDSVNGAARLMSVAAREKGLAFGVSFADSARGQFLGDAVRLRQIVSNLASNAVKFTERGAVTLAVEVAPPEAPGAPSVLSIRIEDTGIGFDAETAARLFQRFEQGDASITRRFGGTGLGLAISRALAQTMGGDITATSTPGVGSAFTLRLPLARLDQPELAERPEQIAAPGAATPSAKLRVLVAEDHPVNQRAFQLMLEAMGVDVTLAENGEAAIAAFRHGTFDLILMDMQMPVMDGLTATRAIRDLEQAQGLARTAIAMVSANAMADHVDQALAAGCDFHLSKPITPARLAEGIRRALQQEIDADGGASLEA